MPLLLLLIILKILFQGETAGIHDDNNSNDIYIRLKESIENKEAELRNEILGAIKKLEDTKTQISISTAENIKKFFEHPLLKENINCRDNEKMRIIKHYTRQFSVDIMSCFNFTESLADAEVLLYNGGNLLTNISATVADVVATLIACQLKGPLLKYLCYINELNVIKADLYAISNSTSVFIASVEKMMSTLAIEFEDCLFDTKTHFLNHGINEIKKKLNSCE